MLPQLFAFFFGNFLLQPKKSKKKMWFEEVEGHILYGSYEMTQQDD